MKDWLVSIPTERQRGPKRRQSLNAAAAPPMSGTERMRRHRSQKARERIENIAILDMETDPFDACEEMIIRPFLAVLYSDKFDTIVIWEEDENAFAEKVCAAIETLPARFTIYAHNGGRFDFMFLIHKLRGPVAFKGRGIMAARIGEHELRDSYNIIPERLANWQKDKFDYTKLERKVRNAHRNEIITYCIADCRYLLDIVKAFVEGFGLKLTIGQAAMAELRKHYDVPKFESGFDDYIRQWFYGGRVECIRGRGEFTGDYKLYDVNSLYPHVMSSYLHPIGSANDYVIRRGDVSENTVFIDLSCKNNGALIGKTESGETTARIENGHFRTTVWEYRIATKYNLISDVRINYCVDCSRRSDFRDFVIPLYDNRLRTKAALDRMKQEGRENCAAYLDMKKDDIFYKLLLNNAYGKFAINPRRFKEYYLTDPDEAPPDKWFKSLELLHETERQQFLFPSFESAEYWIWQKPSPGFRFNNVGVAASITGAARSILLEALQWADRPIYCDTDSIICRDLRGVEISKTALGAWDLENEFSSVIIAGKKLYAVELKTPKRLTPEQIAEGHEAAYTVKSKGTSRLSWSEMDCILHGAAFGVRNRAPTLDRFSDQYYVKRTIRATAPFAERS
jgi:hypothetical protein